MFPGLLSSLFDLKNVKSAFAATFKERPNNGRSCMLILGNYIFQDIVLSYISGACFLIEMFLITGKGPTLYLYYRRKFSWDAKTFGMFIGFYGLLGMFAQFFAVPILSKRFKWSDSRIGECLQKNICHLIFSPSLALIGIIGTIGQFVLVCFTPITMTYLVYVGGIISFLSVSISTAYR